MDPILTHFQGLESLKYNYLKENFEVIFYHASIDYKFISSLDYWINSEWISLQNTFLLIQSSLKSQPSGCWWIKYDNTKEAASKFARVIE